MQIGGEEYCAPRSILEPLQDATAGPTLKLNRCVINEQLLLS